MALTSFGSFSNSNTALQNNVIKLQFTSSTDKTRVKTIDITYQYCYQYTPLYCGNDSTSSSTNYAYFNDANWTTSGWSTISSYTLSGTSITALVTTPKFSYDVLLRYRIRAVDEAAGYYSSESASGSIALMANNQPQVSIKSATWQAKDGGYDMSMTVTIDDIGITRPYNYSTLRSNVANKTCFQYWNASLKQLFNPQFRIGYSASQSQTRPAKTDKITLAIDSSEWINGTDIVVSNLTGNTYSANESYYLWASIYLASYTTSANISPVTTVYYSPYQLLQSIVPVFQIKKGGIKTNIPQANKTQTGGGMFDHTALVADKDGIVNNGHSIALYDTHADGATIVNRPSIGFFNDKNTQIGEIWVENISPLNGEPVIGFRSGGKANDAFYLTGTDFGEGIMTYTTTSQKWLRLVNYQALSDVDFNAVAYPGLYSIVSPTANTPSTADSYFSMLVLKSRNVDNQIYTHQIVFPQGTNDMYVRSGNNYDTWNDWQDMRDPKPHTSLTATKYGAATTSRFGHTIYAYQERAANDYKYPQSMPVTYRYVSGLSVDLNDVAYRQPGFYRFSGNIMLRTNFPSGISTGYLNNVGYGWLLETRTAYGQYGVQTLYQLGTINSWTRYIAGTTTYGAWCRNVTANDSELAISTNGNTPIASKNCGDGGIPIVDFGEWSVEAEGVTFSTNVGYYQRVGKVCFVFGAFVVSSATKNQNIMNGIPFKSDGSTMQDIRITPTYAPKSGDLINIGGNSDNWDLTWSPGGSILTKSNKGKTYPYQMFLQPGSGFIVNGCYLIKGEE